MQFIWLFNFWLWNIQNTGAKKNWGVMKELRRSLHWSNFKEHAILAKAMRFCLVFLQRDFIWGSNVSLLSIWIPRSFSHLLLEIAIPSILICWVCKEDVTFLGLHSEDYWWTIWIKYLTFFLDHVISYSNLC